MMLREESALDLVESLNDDISLSIHMGITHLEDIGLYTATVEELPFILIAERTFVENVN